MSIIKRNPVRYIFAFLIFIFIAVISQNIYPIIALFVGTVRSTDDRARDILFDEAIYRISIDKMKGNGLYDTDLSSYFDKVKDGLSDKEYEDYIDKRLSLKRGPTISNYLGYRSAYQLSANISGITLKSYSQKFSIDERIGFGFIFSDSKYSVLIKSGTYLVYTGLI